MFKAFAVGVVAGVDADFLHNSGRQFSRIGRKVDIGHEWGCVAPCAEFLANVFEVLSLFHTRCRNPDILTPGLDHPNRLLYRTRRVHRIDGSHGLHPNRVIGPHRDIANSDGNGFPPDVFGQRRRIKNRLIGCNGGDYRQQIEHTIGRL